MFSMILCSPFAIGFIAMGIAISAVSVVRPLIRRKAESSISGNVISAVAGPVCVLIGCLCAIL